MKHTITVAVLTVFLCGPAFRPASAADRKPIPDRLVVLTFDDSAKSHYTVVRPLLKQYGFGATFFITQGFDFKSNKQDYMTWKEIAALHRDGFEIGNHTENHKGISAKTVDQLKSELEGIDAQCKRHGIPRPVSFAYPGNVTTELAFPILRAHGIHFARRGGAPEYPYKNGRGFAIQPGEDHPLLLPSAGDARPKWTLDNFVLAVNQARDGRIAVLQFHGVPDTAHDWVNTPKAEFEAYMKYLHLNHYRVIALRDLVQYIDPSDWPESAEAIIRMRQEHLQAIEPSQSPPKPAAPPSR